MEMKKAAIMLACTSFDILGFLFIGFDPTEQSKSE